MCGTNRCCLHPSPGACFACCIHGGAGTECPRCSAAGEIASVDVGHGLVLYRCTDCRRSWREIWR